MQKVIYVRVRRCACVYGEKYLLLVRGVSRSKTLIPLILSQSSWIGFITKNTEQSKIHTGTDSSCLYDILNLSALRVLAEPP